MNHQDGYYLQNHIIVESFKRRDATATSRVFGAIERKYKTVFFGQVMLRGHYLLGDQVLAGIAEDAFSDALQLFHDKVIEDKFEPQNENQDGYLFLLFKGNYLNAYRKELTRKKYEQAAKNREQQQTSSSNTPLLNRPDGIYQAFRAAVKKLPENCQKRLNPREFPDAGEANEEDETTTHAAASQRYRCREKLKEILERDYGLNF